MTYAYTPLTMADRDRIRDLQDRVLAHIDRIGYPDDTVVTNRPKAITVANLRTAIYPDLEWHFLTYLKDYA